MVSHMDGLFLRGDGVVKAVIVHFETLGNILPL